MRSFGAVVALAFVFTGSTQAELVARHVQDGMLALGRNGTPYVAFVRGSSLEIAERAAPGRWRSSKVASVSPGSVLVDFATGRAGPVALVERAVDGRRRPRPARDGARPRGRSGDRLTADLLDVKTSASPASLDPLASQSL